MESEVSVYDLDQTQPDHETANGNLKVFNRIMEIQIYAADYVFIDELIDVRTAFVYVNGQEPTVELWDNFRCDNEGYRTTENGSKVREGLDELDRPVNHSL